MTYYIVKATCPACGRVDELVSVNAIPRLRCADCLVERVEIVDMLLSEVEQEQKD